MNRSYLFLITLAISIGLAACQSGTPKKQAKASPDKLYEDFRADSLHPATLEELQFNSSGDSIFGFSYLANGKGPHPTVVLLHGLPGNERNLDVGQHLRRSGYNVVYFNYRGSWGSRGTFSYENCLGDVRAVLDHITDSVNRERLRVDTRNIFLFGHSMGAGLALIAGLDDSRVKGVVAVSVLNPYETFRGRAAQVNVMDIGSYLSGLGMLNTDPQAFLKGIMNHIEDYNIEKKVAQTRKPVLVIDEHELNDYLKAYSRRRSFSYERWNTDHAFSDRRQALGIRTRTWLDKRTGRK